MTSELKVTKVTNQSGVQGNFRMGDKIMQTKPDKARRAPGGSGTDRSEPADAREQLVATLLRLPLFQDFTQAELAELLSQARYELRNYQKDAIIHLQNETCRALDIILYGRVTVQHIDEHGSVLTIDTFNDGDMIGANLIFARRNTYPMTASAARRTRIMSLEKELILAFCQRSPHFLTTYLSEVSNKTILLIEKINAISRKTIRQSLLDFLHQEQLRQGRTVIRLPMSKKELAERLGIPRSSLGRELIKMRRDGLLTYDAWTITCVQACLDNDLNPPDHGIM